MELGRIDFEYYESVARHFVGDVVYDQWLQLPEYVVGQIHGGTIHMEPKNQPPQEIQDGEAYILPANTTHRYWIHNGGDMYISNAHILYRALGGFDLLSFFACPAVLRGEVAERVGDICRDMVDLSRPGASVAALARKQSLALELLAVILDHSAPLGPGTHPLAAVARLRPALDHINAHLAEPVSRKTLARLSHLSEQRFHVVFKEALGRAPIEHLKAQRLRAAQNLLIETDSPVGEVGAAVGYGDPFHFSRTFKAVFGLSPSEYRDGARARRREASAV